MRYQKSTTRFGGLVDIIRGTLLLLGGAGGYIGPRTQYKRDRPGPEGNAGRSLGIVEEEERKVGLRESRIESLLGAESKSSVLRQ